MNNERVPGIDDLLLDRLVDGELSEQEFRSVIGSMEARPDDWRRCALAFLESQAWRRELGGWPSGPDQPDAPRAIRPAQWSWTWGGLTTLASAASFLLAFFLAAQLFQSSRQAAVSPGDVAREVIGNAPNESLATRETQNRERPWGAYRLVLDGDDGQPQQIEMPIYSHDDPRARWLLNDQATMPAELIRGLQRMGFEVDRQRQWAPVGQNAESPVLVPIEELRVTPVSSRSYQ